MGHEYTGTITIFPAEVLSVPFRKDMQAAMSKRLPVFRYSGVEFHIEYFTAPELYSVRAELHGTTAPLPEVFKHELYPQYIVLRADIPAKLLAKPGWYVGEQFNLPGAFCAVDPRGLHNQGVPRIYADGQSYGNIIALFALVMGGGLEPQTPF